MQRKRYARLAAAFAVLAITGAGWMPSYGINSDYGTGNVIEGDQNEVQGNNNVISGNSNIISGTSSNDNIFTGDSWHISNASENWLVGNGGDISTNLSDVNSSIIFGNNANLVGNPKNHITNAFVVGDNVTLNTVNTGTVIGNDNSIMSVDDSMIIGNGVTITNDKDEEGKVSGIAVIGNDVNVATAGDNITVIGDDVEVDTTANRTDSSNSVIYGNNVTMTNSQNSVAMGNEITMTGNGTAEDDNVAIGHGISLGQSGGGYSTGTVAMGDHIEVNGEDNVVIGGDIDLSENALTDVVVIGHGADTTGEQSVTIGEGASSGTAGVAVGGESLATGNAAAFGFQAVANVPETTVIGPYSQVNSSYSAALGDSVRIGSGSRGSVSIGGHSEIGDNAQYAIAIGGSGGGHEDPDQWTEERTTIGDGATAAIAMGYGASIADYSFDSIALGTNANVNGLPEMFASVTNATMSGIAIGKDTNVQGRYSIAMGANSKVLGNYSNAMESTAIGYSSSIDRASNAAIIGAENAIQQGSSNSSILGTGSSIGTWATNSLALGNAVIIGNRASSSIAMGDGASVAANAMNAVAMGSGSSVNSGWSVALGNQTAVNSQQSVAMGYMSSVGSSANWSIALGGSNVTIADHAEQATALGGYGTSVEAKAGTALGSYSSIEAGGEDSNGEQVKTDYSIAAGYGSKVTAEDIFTAADLAKFKETLGAEYTDLYNIKAADISTAGVFSVGSAGSPRRIINVARGRISADSTDAVNGSQLYGAVKYLEGKIDEAGGSDVAIDGDHNITVNPSAPAADPGTGEGGTTEPGTGTGGSTGGETGGETGGTTGGAGSGSDIQNFTVNMSDNPVFGGHEKDEFGHSPYGSVIVTGSNGANRVAINENNEGGMVVTSGGETVNINKGGDGLVNGLRNTEWDWSKYEAGGYEGSTNAATESQLHELVGGIEQDITDMGDQITSMGDQITNIGNHVDELDGRINEVGAGAAALAALHPLDFDPDEKWDFAAGYGHYRGEDAVAIGAFYRPNEDTMFSVGGTVGNGDEMINAGVSFKIGQGNHVSVSRVAMAKEIIELRKDLEELRSAMASGITGDTLDLSKIQLFPDTPENHWAYDYVATLAGNGILEGYPDGYFNGDRPVTRYEMAAVLYRAMQKGARLSERALREFAPELDRIRVDTITKDEQGMPDIQRVRVIKGRE